GTAVHHRGGAPRRPRPPRPRAGSLSRWAEYAGSFWTCLTPPHPLRGYPPLHRLRGEGESRVQVPGAGLPYRTFSPSPRSLWRGGRGVRCPTPTHTHPSLLRRGRAERPPPGVPGPGEAGEDACRQRSEAEEQDRPLEGRDRKST